MHGPCLPCARCNPPTARLPIPVCWLALRLALLLTRAPHSCPPRCHPLLLSAPAEDAALDFTTDAAHTCNSQLSSPLLLLPAPAEDAALDFTDGTPAEAATVAADFKQKSLIDVEEDVSYEEEEEENEVSRRYWARGHTHPVTCTCSLAA